MLRPEHKYLATAMLVLMLASPLWAFYDGDNRPAGQPPNYTPLDTSYFMGAPRFADYTVDQLGGYYIFKDIETGRWNVIGLVWPGGTLYEQLHGSVLVQMDQQPQEGVNVWPIGFYHTGNLRKNDRWGWVKWPEAIAPNLYEIWWDVTIDVARLSNTTDPLDSVGVSFTGCAFDFNIWATGHFEPFLPEQVKVGRTMTPITAIPGFVDTYPGLSDQYQGVNAPKDPNTSNFTMKDLPGATYGPSGLIPTDDIYGGARAYEGNGVEFSVLACPPPGDNPPVFEPPLGYTDELTICLGSSITDTIRAIDPDQGDVLTMEILSGLGTLTSTPGLSPLYGYFNWTPTSAGAFTIVYKVTDSHGLFSIDSVRYTITLNRPPTVQATDTTITACWFGSPICRTVAASDAEGDPLTFTLLDGIGSIDPTTGELCFTPQEPGAYGFLVAVSDSCGADTVSFTTTIVGNNPPHINPYDSVVVLCAVDSICFDVTASDPDAGDSLAIMLLAGPGQFTQTGNGLGRQCFLPADVDSARYVFRYGVTDDCLRQGWAVKTVPPIPTDSIVIIVITNRPPQIVCPEVQNQLLCSPGIICYTFSAANPGDEALTYTLLSGTGTIDPVTGKLCFYAEASGRYSFTVEAANECGADTCTAVFDVTVDSPPSVFLPDSTVRLCQIEEICLPLTFSDPDDDIVSITVQSEKYAVVQGEVCFVPDGPGTHVIIVTVTDSCGNQAVDTSHVEVFLNNAPQATAPSDTTVMQCTPAEICLSGFDAFDTDGNLASVSISPNIGQLSDGRYCFLPDTAGRYCLTILATDSCGAIDADTVCVTVNKDAPPILVCPPEPVVTALCTADTVCVPIEVGPPGTEVQISTPGAWYKDGQVCFFASTGGEYRIAVAATNDCGTSTCEIVVQATVGIPPILTCPPDTAVHLCGPDSISLPLTVSPADAVVRVLPAGVYKDGRVIFFAGTDGTHCLTVIAETDCGADTCGVCVEVTFNHPPQATAPGDTTVMQCTPVEICLSGFSAFDADGNLASVSITPNIGQLSDGRYCFLPDTAGRYCLTIRATDSCDAMDADTVCVTVNKYAPPILVCPPEPVVAALCTADTVCVPIEVTPAGAVITVDTPGVWYKDGQICFFASTSGEYRIAVAATNDCGTSNCEIVVAVTVGIPPMVTCPGTQTKHLCGPDSIMIPVTISPSNAVVRVLPTGVYKDGQVRFFAGAAGMQCLTVIAETDCGADTCEVCVDVTFDRPPVVSLPDSTVQLCAPAEVCIPLTFSDPDDNIASITIEQPRYKVTEGFVCFMADAPGTNQIIVTVTDSCGLSDVDTSTVIVELNTPPTVEVRDTVVFICGPTEVCLPVTAADADGVIDSVVVTPPAFYNQATQSVCMIVSKSGSYDLMVIAYDDCGASVSTIATIHATANQPPQVIAPPDTAVFQCVMEQICLGGFNASDPDGNLAGLNITPPLGEFIDGRYCFTPTAAGIYILAVTAIDSCGATASDTIRVTVTLNQPPVVAVNDSTAFVCQLTEICLPVEFSDPDGSIDSVKVAPFGYYDAIKQMVCVPVPSAGTYSITVTVYDDCGDSASDQARLTVTLNRPPVLTTPPLVPIPLCELVEVCAEIGATDPDNNLADVRASASCGGPVIYNPATHKLCWTPNAFGLCSLTVIATDGCGAADTALMTVIFTQGTLPDPICPPDTTIRICNPGEICLTVGQLGHTVTIHPTYFNYDPATGKLCYNVQGSRVDTVWVLDATDCGVDSCSFVIRTEVNRPPEVTGQPVEPGRFCDPFSLCIPVEISDPDNNIASIVVDGCYGAAYNPTTREVCIPVADDIDCTVRVTVVDSCGLSAVWSTRVVMQHNNPPSISQPELTTIIRCESDTTAVVVPGFCVTDADYDQVQLSLDSGIGTLSFNPATNCGSLSFTPPTNDSAQYCFRLRASDICDTVFANYCLTILPTAVCSTCVTVSIVGPGCVSVGANATVNLKVETSNSIAGFDLLLAYDASAINFLRADIGPAIGGWEYFTFRYGWQGNCEGNCPSGMLRLVAIADVNNGPAHPPIEQLDPQGIIGSMTFRVVNDANLGGQSIPIWFFWYDCGDNTFSDPTGQFLLLDQSIYSAQGNIIWDEANDASFPENARPPFTGAADTCLEGGLKTVPVRCVTFHNGALCIVHPDSIDARGDMNLNGLSYEIADAVVYTNYFIIGLRAFSVSIPGQIAASDINGDGLTLTVADLVYLIRVITGDAAPYAKAGVPGGPAALECITSGSSTRVAVNASDDIGAALLVFSYEGERPDDPVLGPAAAQMEMKFAWTEDNTLRVLLYSLDAGHAIEATGDLLTIPSSGTGRLVMKEADLADYYGRSMETTLGNAVLPRTMELTQNRPNPFNPSTTFELALPTASEYLVEIYNITGQIIRSWSGSAPAGYVTFEWNGEDNNGRRVSSGIYFYRARAAGAEAIRKMVLLK